MTSSTGAFQGKLWKICVVDLQQGLAWLCWAGELSPRQSAARAGAARARLGLAGSRAGRANGPLAWLGQNGQAGAWLWAGRLGQAGARLWAGKAGWGRLRLGYGQAWLWAGKAGWGRLWLGYGQVRQAGAWLWAGKAGWGRLRLGYGQAGAQLWAGKAGWGRLWLGPNGQAGASLGLSPGKHVGVDLKITRTDALRHVVNQNSTGVDRVMLISKGTHQGREQAMGWLTAEYQEQMQAQKERGKGQSDRRAGHTHTQAEGNRATESIKTEGRPTEDYTRRKIEIPTGGAFRGGFAGRAGQGSAQLGFAGLGPRQVGQARLGLAGSRAGRANDLALKNKYKERRGRLGWVLDRLGSWGLTKGRLGMAGLEVGQTGQFKGRFDLQKPDKNETSTNSSCPRTPKMEKKPKKEKPPGIEENPPKNKTPPGKETSVKDGFKGKTPLAGKGNTVNFE
ncbi:hypothetical protein PPACK8108_LOCUS18873 [Phakopsora pachyrhizi]|uniref:Uncharacterized protein n=1 Tax=Phakopsora pachyrhizi TaxID=170000 RepID=A0AAV0BCV3_PHAPC|nr:hypothetical protein PPACK8108_LOCUS18873 [Phakopsora pachyrhizi]